MKLLKLKRATRISPEEWVNRFSKIHNDKYLYNINQEFRSISKIEIECPIHGVFKMTCHSHLENGCPKCANENKRNKRKFNSNILMNKLINSRNNNNFKYSFLTDSPRIKDKVLVTCPIHGDFEQMIQSHIKGQGCPKCYLENKKFSGSQHLDSENWIEKFKNVHGDIYDYKFPPSYNQYSNIECFCKKCGNKFDIIPYAHLVGKYKCKKCFPGNVSSYELELQTFLSEIGISYNSSLKPDFLSGKELDIFIPEYNIAIEFNGSYWHSDVFLDKWYHFDKWKACNENGIKLLNIWEHYWIIPEKKDIYKSKVKHLLGIDTRIFARKCLIKFIHKDVAIDFIRNNHLEGFNIPYKNSKYIGLFYKDKLLMVAIYGEFFEQSSKVFKWKLQRISTLLGYTVIGGVSKLSKFIKNDIGDFIFQVTLDTGGTIIFNKNIERKDVSLRYWWIKSNIALSRNSSQLNILKNKKDWIEGYTEQSYMEKNGFSKIYDSGVVSI